MVGNQDIAPEPHDLSRISYLNKNVFTHTFRHVKDISHPFIKGASKIYTFFLHYFSQVYRFPLDRYWGALLHIPFKDFIKKLTCRKHTYIAQNRYVYLY